MIYPLLLKAGYAVPILLHMPDGSATPIKYWRDVTIEIVRWFANKGKIPDLPFRGLNSGKRYFLNSIPQHPNAPMSTYQELDTNHGKLYIHTNRSAREFTKCLNALCHAVGANPESISLTLRQTKG